MSVSLINDPSHPLSVSAQFTSSSSAPLYVTTTQALPVTGSVTVSNLPTTQVVTGSITVSNFPTTQAISGSVTVTNATPGNLCANIYQGTTSLSESNPLMTRLVQGSNYLSATNPIATELSTSGAVVGGSNPLPVTMSGSSLTIYSPTNCATNKESIVCYAQSLNIAPGSSPINTYDTHVLTNGTATTAAVFTYGAVYHVQMRMRPSTSYSLGTMFAFMTVCSNNYNNGTNTYNTSGSDQQHYVIAPGSQPMNVVGPLIHFNRGNGSQGTYNDSLLITSMSESVFDALLTFTAGDGTSLFCNVWLSGEFGSQVSSSIGLSVMVRRVG
jgi:hypothetical protein